MDYRFTNDQRQFLADFRVWLDGIDYSGVTGEADADAQELGPNGLAFTRTLADGNWLGMGWPTEWGGEGRSEIERWMLVEELEYRGLPHGGMGVATIGPTIMRVGTERQKREYLPRILSGEIDFALGYSEPNAGSDLASLTTRAVRDGDEYFVNGQKIYTTAAHHATHVWLTVRTGPPESRHRGISVLIVPVDAPGITVRPLHTQSDGRTNEVFYDDVRVPVEDRVGEENQGWDVIRMALDFERVLPYARNRFYYDALVEWARTTPRGDGTVADDPAVRQILARIGVRVELARLLALRTAWLVDRGEVPTVAASMLKIWVSELRQDLAVAALGIFGEEGQQKIGTASAPECGAFERVYRSSPMLKFAGGTNEIQRNIIAQRGLTLPRS